MIETTEQPEIIESVNMQTVFKYYAQLNSGSIVVCVSQLKSEVDATNLILIDDYDTSILGSLYDPTAGTFTPQEIVIDLGTNITKRALSQRLNPVIRAAIRNSTDDIVIDIIEDLKLAEYVDLSDQDLIDSLTYLVYIGIMTQEESDHVLNTPATSSET
jgi:hypothetical protein